MCELFFYLSVVVWNLFCVFFSLGNLNIKNGYQMLKVFIKEGHIKIVYYRTEINSSFSFI